MNNSNKFKFQTAYAKEKNETVDLDYIIENYVDEAVGKLKEGVYLFCPECKKARLNLVDKKYLKKYSEKYEHILEPVKCGYFYKVASKNEMVEYNDTIAIPNPQKIQEKLARFFTEVVDDKTEKRNFAADSKFEKIENADVFETKKGNTRKISQQKIGWRNGSLDIFTEEEYKYYFGKIFMEIIQNKGILKIRVKNLNIKNAKGNYKYIFDLLISQKKISVHNKLKNLQSGEYNLAVYGKLKFFEKVVDKNTSRTFIFKELWINNTEYVYFEKIPS
ncbi:hypothetical protein [Lactococcus garvieae]|uniref:hypothetical protein n=1 Tax=Lactococcus garvieae TaxID=1363 RepID=UPI003855480D